jgi:hypothetical protein
LYLYFFNRWKCAISDVKIKFLKNKASAPKAAAASEGPLTQEERRVLFNLTRSGWVEL